MKIIIFLLSLTMIEIGLLSFIVALAYWPMKGVGLAGTAGLMITTLGAMILIKSYRLMTGNSKNKHNRSVYSL